MSDRRLAVHALVTKSHETLLNDWFLRTLPSDCRPVIHLLDAPPSTFREGHWHHIFIHRVRTVLDILGTTPNDEVLVMSDVDIQFFQPIASDLRRRMEGRHLLFQNNLCGKQALLIHLCAGFIVIRNGNIVRSFFAKALEMLEKANRPDVDDQVVYRDLILSFPEAQAALLPEPYWTNAALWYPGNALHPPSHLMIHHANWVLGVESKIKQLQRVRELSERRSNVVLR